MKNFINLKKYLIVELLVLFILLPLCYLVDLSFHKIIPLVLLFIYCILILLINTSLNIKKFHIQANWNLILSRFIIFCILLFSGIYFLTNQPLLSDLSENRKLFFMIVMYPAFSVFPQELIFREFFFSRYSKLIKNQQSLLLINIALFAFGHIYFQNWIIITGTLIGGAIFSSTYLKTKSLLVVSIEHSLYGLVVLLSGISGYFYKAF